MLINTEKSSNQTAPSAIQASAPPNYRLRSVLNWLMHLLLGGATALSLIPLLAIVGYVLVLGGNSLSIEFFTQAYQSPDFTTETGSIFAHMDEGGDVSISVSGGVLHGIVGTLMVTSLALIIVGPIGILSGVFLAEYRNNRIANVVRFSCDVLSGAPSIIIGVVAYLIIVRTLGFSVFAGSMALSFLMIPTITRTTEEMLKLVPIDLREAAMALGSPQWYATLTVVIPAALPGIVTGLMLAFSRGAGETAPLILTLFGNHKLSFALWGPMAALPLIIYKYTDSPYPAEQTFAWGAAFILTITVLFSNIIMRMMMQSQLKGHTR